MKNKLTLPICLFLFFTLLGLETLGQNAFYDAQRIYQYQGDQAFKDQLAPFVNNPFTSSSTESNIISMGLREKKVVGFNETAGSINSFISPSSQSAIIDGTARFIAERFKEEATTLYINRFREKLDSVQGLNILLPKTHSFMNNANVFDYHSLGNDFKDAFEEDLENFMENTRNYIEQESTIFKKEKLKNAFIFSIDLGDKLVKGYHPIEVLDYLENHYEGKAEFQKYLKVIKGVNILQHHFRKDESIDPGDFDNYKNVWITYSDIKYKLDKPEEFIYFIALIYEDLKEVFPNISVGSGDKDAKAKAIYDEYISPGLTFLNNIEKIQAKGEKLTGDDYVKIFNEMLELLLYYDDKGKVKVFTDSTRTIISEGIEIYQSIYKKDYVYVIPNIISIVELIIDDNSFYAGKEKVLELLANLSRYGSFMVDIVTTKDANAVKEALKTHVTKFSYLDKRQSNFSFTISAQPGIIAGGEMLTTTDTWKANIGITAPIGFEFTWGGRKTECNSAEYLKKKISKVKKSKSKVKCHNGRTIGVMLSFVDLGAVLNYRLDDSDAELPSEITFKQIFSPGAFIQFGLKNSPITIGGGVQYTPQLREVTSNSTDTQSNSLRVGIRVGWDIPLVKIYRKGYLQ